MKYIFKYVITGLIFIIWTKNSCSATYSENVSRLREKIEIDLRLRFGEYSEKNKCFLKKIDKESSDIDGLFSPAEDASHYCLKLRQLEYRSHKNSRDSYQFTVYIFIEGPAVNKKMEILDPFSYSETSNTQSYAYYLLVAQAYGEEKNGFKPELTYYDHLFYTDVGRNGTGIVCIKEGKKNVEPRLGFSAAKTVTLGLGINGYEYDTQVNIVELSSGFFTSLNSYSVKNNTHSTYENGVCRKRK
jgi:hypothetical protein